MSGGLTVLTCGEVSMLVEGDRGREGDREREGGRGTGDGRRRAGGGISTMAGSEREIQKGSQRNEPNNVS